MKKLSNLPDFWSTRLEVNARRAIFHQWEQLEASGCISNFRIAAGDAEGFREGWFFADSDAYKWLEAAARIDAGNPDPRLTKLVDDFIELLGRAQAPDGYLFTYNQIHFPGGRWQNLMIEHELYCLGHLIEAGVSRYEVSGQTDLLGIARRAADRIVADFFNRGADWTSGHEEIEIALLRLHQVTSGDTAYLETARRLIERRGRSRLFPFLLFKQARNADQRQKHVLRQKQTYMQAHPAFKPYILPPGNASKKPDHILLRYYVNTLSGKYFQQHVPVRQQMTPEGHCVRFAYLETAAAMLARISGDRSLLPALEASWERMVTRRMYVTGGIGSLPVLESFGRDDELDPETAYNETCAALGSMFWNWQMAQLTGEARYSDLFEWQLYNAAAVGMGADGATYLYNNPLACREGITRKPWYAVPCCPSNLSRTWADLDRYLFSAETGCLTVHQYLPFARCVTLPCADGSSVDLRVEMDSALPWGGCVRLKLAEVGSAPQTFDLRLRRPSWAEDMRVTVNGQPVDLPSVHAPALDGADSGYDPRAAVFVPVRRLWTAGDEIEISFDLPLKLRQALPRVREHTGRAAVTRGLLVYCLESIDNPGVDIFTARLDPTSLAPVEDADLLDGIVKLTGRTLDGTQLTFIPYFLWGNRGSSQMTVWVNI